MATGCRARAQRFDRRSPRRAGDLRSGRVARSGDRATTRRRPCHNPEGAGCCLHFAAEPDTKEKSAISRIEETSMLPKYRFALLLTFALGLAGLIARS